MTAAHEGKALAFDERLRNGLAVQLDEFWFVVEKFQLARTTGHEKENHVFGFRRKMRRPGREWIDDLGRVRAEIKVCPAQPALKMPDGTTGYPEAVLMRLKDSQNGAHVKLETTEDGAGLVLGGKTGSTLVPN